MKAIRFKGHDTILKPPADWDDDDKRGTCSNLAVAHQDGNLISCWEPSFCERIKLLFGGVVWVFMAAVSHPPIALQAGYASKEPDQDNTAALTPGA